ncbi:MAG: hypothetical protein J6Q21_05115 [Alistipes sp.]|nr:hypothetical protein [Alistipes sp.]
MTKNVNYVAPEMEVVATVVEAGFGLSQGVGQASIESYDEEVSVDWN